MDKKSIKFATNIDHVNNGICSHPIPGALMTAIVVRKFIPVKVEEATNII